MNIVWFRNDLRLADNPALFHAMESQKPVVGLFILNPEQHQAHGEGPQKYEFIKAHVRDLIDRLEKLGVPSISYEVPTYADVTEVFKQLLDDHEVENVYMNASYWCNEKLRDQAVEKVLQQADVKLHVYPANYLLPPASIRKSDGTMYHVFTPYKNKFIEKLKANYELPFSIPEAAEKNQTHGNKVFKQCDISVELSQQLLDLWPIGEQAAAERLKSFVNDNNYPEERDYPAIDGTSSISPYLALGVLSARQCLAYMLKSQGEDAFYSTWVSELIWRDFYNDLMYEYPKLAKHQTFKPDAVDHWQQNSKLLDQWQSGETGFPIVDAGMRQLLAEGWMHNRVRMVVASFLSKLCLLDWRSGEAHFMRQLLDADLASNNGGWQWSSATGCDAAPYFRIFNPTTQSKKFDPDGTYIKKYVPELAAVQSKEIHDPKSETRSACGYPEPVIDYKSARQQALDWFK